MNQPKIYAGFMKNKTFLFIINFIYYLIPINGHSTVARINYFT